MAIKIEPGQIHLWLTHTDEFNENDLLRYPALLNAAETDQWQRFQFENHRQRYLVTRALVRTSLAGYTNLAPEEIQFTKNRNGKPEIKNTIGGKPLRFNLSHCDGLIACAVCLGDDIGVDVENGLRPRKFLEIAQHKFSQDEIEDLQYVPKSLLAQRFWQYWTLKEAFVKAKGLGLTMPLDQFSFKLFDSNKIGIQFSQLLTENPKHWHFWQFKPSENHVLAIAVHSETPQPFCLETYKGIPLVGFSNWGYSDFDKPETISP